MEINIVLCCTIAVVAIAIMAYILAKLEKYLYSKKDSRMKVYTYEDFIHIHDDEIVGLFYGIPVKVVYAENDKPLTIEQAQQLHDSLCEQIENYKRNTNRKPDVLYIRSSGFEALKKIFATIREVEDERDNTKGA